MVFEKRKSRTGDWNLYVHGQLVVREESFTVVEGIEEALNGRGSPTSELVEVADAITRRFG